ncbi:MAG: hypothetical protein AB7I38_14395 [Dehalococcoidia bacterium]
MPGPLPDPNRRRRNAPTIPSVDLPAGGFKGRTPKPPAWLKLGSAGLAWWKWAWHTPQAARWAGGGFDVVIARRAQLEDDLAALDTVDMPDLDELIQVAGELAEPGDLKILISRLAALTSGRLAIAQKMLDIEDRLGLTPKGLETLRWRIVDTSKDDAPTTSGSPEPGVTRIDERRARLTGAS